MKQKTLLEELDDLHNSILDLKYAIKFYFFDLLFKDDIIFSLPDEQKHRATIVISENNKLEVKKGMTLYLRNIVISEVKDDNYQFKVK